MRLKVDVLFVQSGSATLVVGGTLPAVVIICCKNVKSGVSAWPNGHDKISGRCGARVPDSMFVIGANEPH